MDINVTNLDDAYRCCKNLNDFACYESENSGGILQRLYTNIKSLKAHWVGNDAMVHINNLIVVYRVLGKLLGDAKSLSAAAGGSITAIQSLQKKNGGDGNVGEDLDDIIKALIIIPDVEPTNGYFVDPAARNDYNELVDIHNKYEEFVKKFQECKDDLLKNWTAGAGHDNAVRFFKEFDENCGVYNGYINNAKEELGKALQNITNVAIQ